MTAWPGGGATYFAEPERVPETAKGGPPGPPFPRSAYRTRIVLAGEVPASMPSDGAAATTARKR